MQKNIIKCVVPVIIIIVGVLWYLLSYEISQEKLTGETVFDLRQDVAAQGKETIGNTEEPIETSARLIAVHVCGAVVNPGVYQFEKSVRVVQVIEAAGGVCDGGMPDYLNLAKIVSDGERIYVPSNEEVDAGIFQEGKGMMGEDVLCININTATKAELMQLPGIGESKADSIISYRQEHGNFKTIEDIMQISGIKEAVYSRIKDYIKVQN